MRPLLIALVVTIGLPVLLAAQNRQDTVPLPVKSGFYSSFDHTPIYYEVRGQGYPVILVHGFIVNGESWKKTPLFFTLLANGFQVITLDQRGNGKSGKPHSDTAYAHDAEAKDIMGLATYLGLRSYNAAGYSRGSIITARLLVLDKRVKQAVLGGMGADFTNPEWPRRKMFARALMGDTVKELEGMVNNVKKAGLDQAALALLQKEQPSASAEELAALRKPVLVICGSEDADNGNAQQLAKLIPGSLFKTVPGNHDTALRSKEMAAAVLAFFKGEQ